MLSTTLRWRSKPREHHRTDRRTDQRVARLRCAVKEAALFRRALLSEKRQTRRHDRAAAKSSQRCQHIEQRHRTNCCRKPEGHSPQHQSRHHQPHLANAIGQRTIHKDRQCPEKRERPCKIAIVRCAQRKRLGKIRKEKRDAVVHQPDHRPGQHHQQQRPPLIRMGSHSFTSRKTALRQRRRAQTVDKPYFGISPK